MTLIAMQGLMAAASAPPAGGGLSPIQIGTLPTFWYDGDNSPHYKGQRTSDGAATLNNDSVVRADSVAGSVIRCFSEPSVTTGLRKIPVEGSSNGMYKSGISSQFPLYTRPTGTNLPTVATAASNLFSAANATLVMALRVDTASPDTGTVYGNTAILNENAGYFGLFCYRAGSNIVFQAYNWDAGGSTQKDASPVPIATWVVVAMKHTGGQLRIYINGVQIGASVASGNTSNLTGQALFSGADMATAQFATWNANISDDNILEVSRYFGAKVGIVI